jgi:hypothetical protein
VSLGSNLLRDSAPRMNMVFSRGGAENAEEMDRAEPN